MTSPLKERLKAMMSRRMLPFSITCLLTACLLTAAACGGDPEDAPTPAQAASESVTASKLAADYELDEAGAIAKYDGKELDIDGSVISSGTNKSGVSYVILQGSGVSFTPGTAVECVLTDSGLDALSRVSVMQVVTIRGTIRGFSDTVKDIDSQFALFNSTGKDIAVTECSVLP